MTLEKVIPIRFICVTRDKRITLICVWCVFGDAGEGRRELGKSSWRKYICTESSPMSKKSWGRSEEVEQCKPHSSMYRREEVRKSSKGRAGNFK